MIGKRLDPILSEIESVIIEYEYHCGAKPDFSTDSFRAATKIFMTLLMDKMWEVQEYDKLSKEDRCNMAQRAGEDLRKLIKSYTGIDSYDFYKKGL